VIPYAPYAETYYRYDVLDHLTGIKDEDTDWVRVGYRVSPTTYSLQDTDA